MVRAIALSIILYFAPQKIKKTEVSSENTDAFSFESLLSSAKGSLKRQEAEPIMKLENELSKSQSAQSGLLLDSLGKQWDKLDQPVISSHYFEMVALQQ